MTDLAMPPLPEHRQNLVSAEESAETERHQLLGVAGLYG